MYLAYEVTLTDMEWNVHKQAKCSYVFTRFLLDPVNKCPYKGHLFITATLPQSPGGCYIKT